MKSASVRALLLAMRLSALVSITATAGASAAPPPRVAACLPKTVGEPYVPVALHLASLANPAGGTGAWLICWSERGVGPKACWEVDRKKGTLKPHAAELVPGISYRVVAEGCVAGLCLPPLPAPTNPRDPADGPREAILSVHADGKRAVVLLEGHQFVVFDRATRKVLTLFDLRGPPNSEVETIGNVPVSLWFLGETIFVEGFDAGPGAYVGAYRADGTPIGVIKPPGSEYVLDTYKGHVSALDATHLGISADGLRVLYAVSGATGAIDRTLTRKVPAAPCNVDDFAEWTTEWLRMEAAKPACRAFIAKHLAPWPTTQLVADGEGFLAFDPNRAQLIELDRAFVAKRRVALKRCPK